ncbi:MAG: aspartate kinase [Nitrososphaeria archaeon]|nr:aspartate kinase [Nitrososphaeria archaeon]NIQ33017.1 aspartate kinase [Nitrososphaeria archaeon]
MSSVTDRLYEEARKAAPGISPEKMDSILSLGEEHSARLLAAALVDQGLEAVAVGPLSPQWPIFTNGAFGDADPILDLCRRKARENILPLVEEGKIPVVCGFLGREASGRITTLGRGGSDTTAVLLAGCLGFDEVILVKDVKGFYTADPRLVDTASQLESLDADEAYYLASGGAKVIHNKALRYKPPKLKIRIVFGDESLFDGGTIIEGDFPDLEVEVHGEPVTMITVVGDEAAEPGNVNLIAEKTKESGGKIMSMGTVERALIIYVEGGLAEVLNSIHDLIREKKVAKAVSALEGIAMITVRGKNLETAPGLIQKISIPLTESGINIFGLMTIHSSIRLFVSWEVKDKVTSLVKEVLDV